MDDWIADYKINTAFIPILPIGDDRLALII